MGSRIHLNSASDPMAMFRSKYLIQCLIYNAYFLFAEQQWLMKDIVIVPKCEHAMISLYNQFEQMRNGNNKWFKSKRSKHKKNASVQLPQIFYNKQEQTKFVSQFKHPTARNSDLLSIQLSKNNTTLMPRSPVLKNQMSSPLRKSVSRDRIKAPKLSPMVFHKSDGATTDDMDDDDIDFKDDEFDNVVVPKRNDLNRKRSRSQPPTPYKISDNDIDNDPVTPFDVGDFHPVLFDIGSDSTQKWENGKKAEQRHSSNYHGPKYIKTYSSKTPSITDIVLNVDNYKKQNNKIITTPNMLKQKTEKSDCSSIDYQDIIDQVGDVLDEEYDDDDIDDNDKKQNIEKPKLEEMKTNEWMESVFDQIVAEQDDD